MIDKNNTLFEIARHIKHRRLKKVLKNSDKTNKYLKSLDKVYLIGLWTQYGYREHYFTGEFDENNVPLIYDYYDFNGMFDEWHLMPIYHTTSAAKLCYVFDENVAIKITNALNMQNELKNNYFITEGSEQKNNLHNQMFKA